MKLQELVAALGGNENIANITHCMTRLRFKLVDESKADKAKLEAIQGVKGVVLGQGQTQVIIGVDVEKWYLACLGQVLQKMQKSSKRKASYSKTQCAWWRASLVLSCLRLRARAC